VAKKHNLPFDKVGGTLVLNRRLLTSNAFTELKPTDKVLITLLQLHWRNDKPVSYGVREAAKKIPCSINTAGKSFSKLQEHGFIECVEQSQFSSRLGSRARDWRLTWLPYLDQPPTNEWEQWRITNSVNGIK